MPRGRGLIAPLIREDYVTANTYVYTRIHTYTARESESFVFASTAIGVIVPQAAHEIREMEPFDPRK